MDIEIQQPPAPRVVAVEDFIAEQGLEPWQVAVFRLHLRGKADLTVDQLHALLHDALHGRI